MTGTGMARRGILLVAVLCVALSAGRALAEWDPAAFEDQDTLDFLTVGPEEGEHWSRVWLVVLDGQVYVRLGRRAAARVERNTTAPFVKVRVAGQEFARVRVEAVPELAERVAAAMAEKYPTDLIIRLLDHPLTARLVPEVQRAEGVAR